MKDEKYIVIRYFHNGDVEYYGPFKNHEEASTYADHHWYDVHHCKVVPLQEEIK